MGRTLSSSTSMMSLATVVSEDDHYNDHASTPSLKNDRNPSPDFEFNLEDHLVKDEPNIEDPVKDEPKIEDPAKDEPEKTNPVKDESLRNEAINAKDDENHPEEPKNDNYDGFYNDEGALPDIVTKCDEERGQFEEKTETSQQEMNEHQDMSSSFKAAKKYFEVRPATYAIFVHHNDETSLHF